MRTYDLFRAARVQFCLVLFFVFGFVQVDASNQVNCKAMALPQNAAPFLPGSITLFNRLEQVDSNRLMQTITDLQNMITRHVLSPKHSADKGIGAAASYITEAFKSIDPESKHLIVTNQKFYTRWADKTIQLENIIAILPGSEPELGAFVVGAHYDSLTNDPNDGSSPAPGADNDGSGIAALIEMVHILNTSQPRVTIMFVAFSGEEIGRAGSIHFVRDYLQALHIPIHAMINLDVIGGSGQDGISVDGNKIRLFSSKPDDRASRAFARTIQFIANQYVPQMGILIQDRADRPGRFGDQQSFSDEGYQAVRLTEEIENMNREHAVLDTADHIQPEYLADSTRAVLAAVTVLADGPTPPQGESLVDNPDGSRSLNWDVVSDAASYIVALQSPDSMVYDNQFEVIGTHVTWTGFDSRCAKVLAIAAKDAEGLMGTFSGEYDLP